MFTDEQRVAWLVETVRRVLIAHHEIVADRLWGRSPADAEAALRAAHALNDRTAEAMADCGEVARRVLLGGDM